MSYTILDPAAILAYIIAHRGSGAAPQWWTAAANVAGDANVSIRYRFTQNGACTVRYRLTALKQMKFGDSGYVGAIQAGRLDTPPGGTLRSFIPGVVDFMQGSHPYSFGTGTGQDMAAVVEPVQLTSSKWTDASLPPSRFYQYRVASNGVTRDYGLALGFNTTLGMAVPATRAANLAGPWGAFGYQAPSTKRMYPTAYSGSSPDKPIDAGTVLDVEAYRAPFDPAAYPPAVLCYSWYWSDNDVILSIEFSSAFNGAFALPSYLGGMSVSTIEQSDVSVGSSVVEPAGIKLTTTGAATCVLRLSPAHK